MESGKLPGTAPADKRFPMQNQAKACFMCGPPAPQRRAPLSPPPPPPPSAPPGRPTPSPVRAHAPLRDLLPQVLQLMASVRARLLGRRAAVHAAEAVGLLHVPARVGASRPSKPRTPTRLPPASTQHNDNPGGELAEAARGGKLRGPGARRDQGEALDHADPPAMPPTGCPQIGPCAGRRDPACLALPLAGCSARGSASIIMYPAAPGSVQQTRI